MNESVRKKRPSRPKINPRSGPSGIPWKRFATWGVIVLLLVVVVLEWMSQRNFEATRKEIDLLVQATQHGATGKPLKGSEVPAHVHGFAFRGTSTKKDLKQITLHWPSLFRTYKLNVIVDAEDKVMYATVAMPEDKDDQPVVAKSAAPYVETRPLPKRGLAQSSSHPVALNISDVESASFFSEAGSLVRELFRQAFLMTARDEYGLATWDLSLGEDIADNESAASFPFEFKVLMPQANTQGAQQRVQYQVEVSRPNRDGKWFSWTSPPIVIEPQNVLESLTERAEAFSHREFVDALKEAGLQKATSVKSTAVAAIPLDAPQDFVSQFGLIRTLHAQIKSAGESDELLGALARSYANLGSLVDFHWSPASKVFKARALLYAQRLVSRQGKTPFALAHRAYARGLAGRHATAIDDIKAAREAQGAAAPRWIDAIDAFCSYQPSVLDRWSAGSPQLIAYLRMRMCDPKNSEKETLECVSQFMELNDACCRTTELLCETGALGVRRAVTESGFTRQWPAIYSRISQLRGLPEQVKSVSDLFRRESGRAANVDPDEEFPARRQLIEHLRRAGTNESDAGEPSWTVLAELLSDVSLLQVWRQLDVDANALGVPTDGASVANESLTKGHRYEKFIRSFTSNQNERRQLLSELAASVNPVLLEQQARPMGQRIYSSGEAQLYARIRDPMDKHADWIFDDLIRQKNPNNPDDDIFQSRIRQVSPLHPASISWQIEQEWAEASIHAPQWEQAYADSPQVIMALAKQYDSLEQFEDEERILTNLIRLNPSHAAYRKLAGVHEQLGDMVRCQEILREALELPSFGLEDASIRTQVSNIMMRAGKWREAQDFANEAAASYAGWALLTAARCAEGLDDWPTAEAVFRAYADRYGGENWYFWCYRTKHGNLAAASALAKTNWRNMNPPYSSPQRWSRGAGYLISGNVAQAHAVFTDSLGDKDDSMTLLFAALLSDELDKKVDRDAQFQLVAKARNRGLAAAELVNLFQLALAKGDQVHWNRKSFDHLTMQAPDSQITYLYLFAGLFLNKHGDPAAAREYFALAASSFDVNSMACLVATIKARELKIDIPDPRSQEMADSLASVAKILVEVKAAVARKQFEQALTLSDQAVNAQPDLVAPLIARAKIHQLLDDSAKSNTDLLAAIALNPESDVAHRELAWIYAASPQESARNGAKALDHATKAFALRTVKTAADHAVLAAAYAEQGDFKLALQNEQTANRLQPGNKETWARIQSYRKQQAYRLPSKNTASIPK